jgi:hypothetical protein
MPISTANKLALMQHTLAFLDNHFPTCHHVRDSMQLLTCHMPRRAPRRGVVTRAAAGNGSGKRITQQEFTEKAWQAVVAAPEIATEYQQQVRLQH